MNARPKRISFTSSFDMKTVQCERGQQNIYQNVFFVCQTMEVMEDDGELVFLYHLKDGHADCSYALNVAKVAGIDDHIIKRGEEVRFKSVPCGAIRNQPHFLEESCNQCFLSWNLSNREQFS